MSERYKMPIPSADKPPYFIYTGKETDHGFLSSMYKNIQPEQLDSNTIKLHGNIGFMHTVGSYLVMTHATREYPGILVTDSRKVALSDLTLYPHRVNGHRLPAFRRHLAQQNHCLACVPARDDCCRAVLTLRTSSAAAAKLQCRAANSRA